MVWDLRNIHPLSDFQRSAKSFLATLKVSQSPIVLTVNGKAAVVVQDAEGYQLLIERLELLESMVGIRKSLAEFEQGKGIPLEEAFRHLQEKHDIPDGFTCTTITLQKIVPNFIYG
jgi:PHD/YefM family antitoxin component YafN of YafNO toxin-antitoxin module